MTFRHVVVSLAVVTCLSACESGDTIVTLNVSATDQVPDVERLQVTLTQGSRKHVHEFKPPTDSSTPAEGEEPQTSIKNSFFHRITLPGDWDEATAKLVVEAVAAGGGAFDPPLGDETEVTIDPNGVVAAYVQLDIPMDPPPPTGEGGAGGAGGADGVGGAPGLGGADSGGASTDAGGAGVGGEPGSGAAGEAASGGAGGDAG